MVHKTTLRLGGCDAVGGEVAEASDPRIESERGQIL